MSDIGSINVVPASKSTRRNSTIAVIVILLLYVGSVGFSSIRRQPTWVYGRSMPALERAIGVLKHYPLPVGACKALQISPSLDPATISPQSSEVESRGYYRLFVYRATSSKYVVEFVTIDNGHAGMSGLVYVDRPEQLELRHGSRIVGTFWLPEVEKKLSAHWYSCYNDLF